LIRIQSDPRYRIVGVGAGELIAEGVLAIEMAALASDVAMTITRIPRCRKP